MAITKIPAAGFTGNNFRNIIINGDMSIAQRGTSASNVSTGYHTVDRFSLTRGAGTLDVSQETDAPNGSGFVKSFKVLENGSGASPGASDVNILLQRFEGQNLQYLKKGTSSAESLTLSFWIKAKVTGTYIAELYDSDNTRQISKTYTVSSSETWEKKTITYDGDTSGTLNNDNGSSLQVNLFFTAGSNFTSGTLNTSWGSRVDANRAVGQVNALASASDYVQITGVQLEAGTTASDFEFLPYDVNLQRCQRYYYEVTNPAVTTEEFSIGSVYAAGQFETVFPYPVTMRAQPSSSVTSGASQMSVLTNQTNDAIDGLSGAGQIGINQGMRFTSGDNFGGTQGHAGRLRKVSADVRINFSAEL